MTRPAGESDPLPSAMEVVLRKLRDGEPVPAFADAELARRQLREANAELSRVTGGAPPGAVLAELAQQLAAELALHWEDLPGHRFTGRVARVPGVLGAMVPGRRVPHRVVLARYLSSTPARNAGDYRIYITVAGVLGLGADGVLRTGLLNEAIQLPAETRLPDTLLRWDDGRIRRVPSRTVWVSRWGAGRELRVTKPGEVLDALAALAGHVAEASRRDLELLQRLLGTGE